MADGAAGPSGQLESEDYPCPGRGLDNGRGKSVTDQFCDRSVQGQASGRSKARPGRHGSMGSRAHPSRVPPGGQAQSASPAQANRHHCEGKRDHGEEKRDQNGGSDSPGGRIGHHLQQQQGDGGIGEGGHF